MALNQGSIAISAVYRGSTLLSAVYSGANLVWPTTPTTQTTWLTSGLNNILNELSAGQDVYSTSGLNIKLK